MKLGPASFMKGCNDVIASGGNDNEGEGEENGELLLIHTYRPLSATATSTALSPWNHIEVVVRSKVSETFCKSSIIRIIPKLPYLVITLR